MLNALGVVLIVVVLALVLAGVLVVLLQLPELRRYRRLRAM